MYHNAKSKRLYFKLLSATVLSSSTIHKDSLKSPFLIARFLAHPPDINSIVSVKTTWALVSLLLCDLLPLI